MKFLKNVIRITALSVISMFITSCTTTTTTSDYYTLIPSNSIYVTSINCERLDEDANLTEAQIDIIVKKINAPIDFPFDKTEPMYMFVTDDMKVGIVAKIKNAEEFASSFDVIKNSLDISNDTQIEKYTLAHNDEIAIAYKDNSFILMGDINLPMYSVQTGKKIKVGESVIAIMNGEAEPFSSTDNFKELKSNKNDISNITICDDNSPLFYSFDKYVLGSYCNFETGKIVAEMDYVVVPTKLQKIVEKYTAKPDGKFDGYIPSDYIMYANSAVSMNEDPKELLDLYKMIIEESFKSIATINNVNSSSLQQNMTMVKNAINEILEHTVSSFNGDVVLTINSMPMIPEVVFMADVRDDSILNALLGNIPAQMVTKKAENQYVVNATIVNIEVGVKDNVFYIINSPTTFKAFSEGKKLKNNFTSTPFAKKIKGTFGGLDIRVDALMSSPLLNMGLAKIGMQEVPVMSKIDNMELVVDDLESSKLYINMKDKDNNALNTIMIDMLDLLSKGGI